MGYVIGVLIALIVIIIVALIIRKRLYDQVDYYEDWKLDIMNRNVANELAKVKELKLEGDTKDRFEHWKNQWDAILNEDMADVEELLYDTEKAADRYNFPGAKKHMQKMNGKLARVEEKIEKILKQLNELLDIEKVNRDEVSYIKPKLTELKKHLTKYRYQYNRAEIRFEVEIDEIAQELETYDEMANEGNYAEGAAIVSNLKERTDKLEKDINEFPQLYKACKTELPQQLDDLAKGIAEMQEEGYHVEHLGLNKEITEYQGQLLDLVKELEEQNAEEAKIVLPEMEVRVKEMYDLLEEEALAKNYVESKMSNYERALTHFSDHFTDTKSQVDKLRETYYFEDTDLEKYLSLEKQLTQLKDQLEKLHTRIAENEAHTATRDELQAAFEQLELLEQAHEQFRENIHSLRKDELEAREQLQEMSDEMYKMNRKLKHSNLPGVPNFIWRLIDESSEKNERVLTALDQQPLDMVEVNKTLKDAKSSVETAMNQIHTMLEQAYLTEHVIQYANRYRSSYPMLHDKLTEAERLFRKSEYELSLEEAAKALEEIEPGALKKVEQYQDLTVS